MKNKAVYHIHNYFGGTSIDLGIFDHFKVIVPVFHISKEIDFILMYVFRSHLPTL